MTVLVGSRHEGYGETGMAHLLEHMVFKGTPTHPQHSQGPAGPRGAVQRHHVADRTNYFETLPATDENLEFAIRLEADRLVNSFVRREDLVSEMTVVRNEFERSENSPSGVLDEADDGGRLRVAQLRQDRPSATAATSSACRSRTCRRSTRSTTSPTTSCWSSPASSTRRKALELVQKYFGVDPAAGAQARHDLHRRAAAGRRAAGDAAARRRRRRGRAWRITSPPGRTRMSPRCRCSPTFSARRPSGRLYKALVETKKATSVFASARRPARPGLLTMQRRSAATDRSLDDVRDIDARHGRTRSAPRASPTRKSTAPSSRFSRPARWPQRTPARSPLR